MVTPGELRELTQDALTELAQAVRAESQRRVDALARAAGLSGVTPIRGRPPRDAPAADSGDEQQQ